MSGVFISYRREDGGGYAGRLFDILSAHFGRTNTYMDLDTIKGGDDFAAVIEEKVGQCSVLLAVIGERWLTITGENGGRRLDMAGDFVRLEIAKALERHVRVVPVLVGGAGMPRASDLPDDLRPLADHQAMDLRDAHFHADAGLLIDLLNRTVPGLGNRRWAQSRRFATAMASTAAAAAVVGGLLLLRHMRPAVEVSHDSPAQTQVAPANGPIAKGPADIAGKWKGTVKYDWGDVYTEVFDFEAAGPELSGTASFLEHDRGIFDGKIEGDRVSFMTKSQTALGDKTYEDKHYYKGTVEGNAIRFSMLIDSGAESHVPVHFTANRVGAK
jgi:hypothetical protein